MVAAHYTLNESTGLNSGLFGFTDARPGMMLKLKIRRTSIMGKLLLTLIFLAAGILPATAVERNAAVEKLKAEAGSISINLPEPVAAAGKTDAPVLSGPRADWLAASALYGKNFAAPKSKNRLDIDHSSIVMMQGFHWYADRFWYDAPRGWWGVLEEKAGEIGNSGFDMIWFPPVSNGSYYPNEWYNLDSQWGQGDVLMRAISAMHSSGLKVLGDLVLNHRSSLSGWMDFKNPDMPSTAIVNNDEVWGQPEFYSYPRSPNTDEGDGDFGSRDLDHKDWLVQRETTTFLRWLRYTLGFDGWRYDMTKGFAPYHVGEYNAISDPVFSMGEYYDTNRQLLANWVDGTDSSAGKAYASSTLDFPTRYSLV